MNNYIIIGADLVPTAVNEQWFIEGSVDKIVGEELGSLLAAADYRVFNLEVPLINNGTPIKKHGPALAAHEETINGIAAFKPNLVTLANNHIMDQGKDGLERTLNILRQNGIETVGVGKNLSDAKKPHYFVFSGRKVGIFACAEHEFSIATDTASGANPYEQYLTDQDIQCAKQNCDYLIVLYHGGKELYQYPTPELQKRCHDMARSGADLILCQHGHCIGCREAYYGCEILYGQGNFVFHLDKNDLWKTGMLVKIDASFCVSYIPLVNDFKKVWRASDSEEKEILAGLEKRSQQILNDNFVRDMFTDYARRIQKSYYVRMSGLDNNLLYLICSKFGLTYITDYMIRSRIKDKNKLAILNYMECETHREILRVGLGDEK